MSRSVSSSDTAAADSPQRLLRFDNLYRFADAMMLAGARLAPMRGPAPGRLVALCLARSKPQWPLLAWAVSLAEAHGFRMRLATGGRTVGMKLGYRSGGDVFLHAAYERWYPPVRGRCAAVTPADITLCEQTFAVWCAAALARQVRGRRSGLLLRAPQLAESPSAHLAAGVRSLGWKVSLISQRSARALQLDGGEYDMLCEWLRKRIPEPVWNGK